MCKAPSLIPVFSTPCTKVRYTWYTLRGELRFHSHTGAVRDNSGNSNVGARLDHVFKTSYDVVPIPFYPVQVLAGRRRNNAIGGRYFPPSSSRSSPSRPSWRPYALLRPSLETHGPAYATFRGATADYLGHRRHQPSPFRSQRRKPGHAEVSSIYCRFSKCVGFAVAESRTTCSFQIFLRILVL